MINVITLLPQH